VDIPLYQILSKSEEKCNKYGNIYFTLAIKIAQDRDRWGALVNAIMNFQVP
jgi:hypothetical protein